MKANLQRWAVAAALMAPLSQWANAATPALDYRAPVVIRTAGTYTGNYRSFAAGVPAIEVYASGQVVIENCNVAGPGPLIRVWSETSLVIRNCNGYGETDTPGKFLESANLKSLVMENNYFENVSKGVLVYQFHGKGGAGESIRIVGNIGLNMRGADRPSFLQFNQVLGVSNVEIAYNQVINMPGASAVEDNINLYNSSGTTASPILVHDNYVQGAYPRDLRWGFTGSGMTIDGDGTLSLMSHDIEARDNTILSTCNAGMNIAGGYNIRYHDNRIVTSSQLPDGSGRIPDGCTWAGTAGWNYFNLPSGSPYFRNDSIDHNVIGFVRTGSNAPYANRNDLSPDCPASICHDNVNLPNPVTLDTEKGEWLRWSNKLATAQKRIGSSTHSNSGISVAGSGGHPYKWPGATAATPTMAWALIGYEFDTLTVASGTTVKYGLGTQFVEKVVSGSFTASNGFFGSDPVPGYRKEVYARSGAATAPIATPNVSWTLIGYEFDTLTVASGTTVKYGLGTQFVEKVVSGSFVAGNGFFGSDPVPGYRKEVYARSGGAPVAAPTVVWTLIGFEFDTLTVAAGTTVKYGLNAQFVEKVVSGSFVAGNGFFGSDPVPGYRKEVYAKSVVNP